ncbi:MAG: hypothetical protein PVF05_13150 [Gemmatimonadales bacterium]|jgi:hypothetical protein
MPRSIGLGWTGALLLLVVWLFLSVWLVRSSAPNEWIPTVVSGLGLLVALGVAVWTIAEQRRITQMNFAVTLWGQWSEESMLEARNRAWDALASLPLVDGRKRVGELRFGSQDQLAQYRSIARVNHVFADLNDFLDAGLLHRRDVEALFRDTLQAYYCHLLVVDIARGMEAAGGADQQIWFEDKVLGLADHLRLRRPADYRRYGATLADNLRAAGEA